jgi:Pyridoxamine 5'-phosphate oxidase
MYETTAEIADLQGLLDRSFAGSSGHLRSIMTSPRRMAAERLVTELDGACVLNIATVTARGEPRVSAVDGHFLHGHWYFTTAGDSPKARQLAARPAISAGYTPTESFGLFCHGRTSGLDRGTPEFAELVAHWIDFYGQSPDSLGDDIVYLRIDASWLVAFAMTDAETEQIMAERQARRSRHDIA